MCLSRGDGGVKHVYTLLAPCGQSFEITAYHHVKGKHDYEDVRVNLRNFLRSLGFHGSFTFTVNVMDKNGFSGFTVTT